MFDFGISEAVDAFNCAGRLCYIVSNNGFVRCVFDLANLMPGDQVLFCSSDVDEVSYQDVFVAAIRPCDEGAYTLIGERG